MRQLEIKYKPDKEYHELFNVMIDSLTCEDTAIGITNDGELLYIKSKLANSSSAYWVDREFFSIDNDEFCSFLKQAQANGYIEKAIRSGQTTEEELYKFCK